MGKFRNFRKFQNLIFQRIFNQSSPNFYPQWSLVVAIQSCCQNYPVMSRFGQTGDKKFRADFEFDLKKQVKVIERQVTNMASYKTPFLQSFVEIRSYMTKSYGFAFSGFWHKNGSATLKSGSRSLKLGQCSQVNLGSILVQVSRLSAKLRLGRNKESIIILAKTIVFTIGIW